eukprot:7391545-Pyramimonas_sp.AAC.1
MHAEDRERPWARWPRKASCRPQLSALLGGTGSPLGRQSLLPHWCRRNTDSGDEHGCWPGCLDSACRREYSPGRCQQPPGCGEAIATWRDKTGAGGASAPCEPEIGRRCRRGRRAPLHPHLN